MTVGPFKRFGSFFLDFILIIAFVFTLWNIFGANILERILDYEATEGLEYYATAAFHIIGFAVINYLYQGFSKGRTLGRKFLYIRLSGPLSWGNLFMREIIWKSYIWIFAITFININYMGFAIYLYMAFYLIDFLLIAFTKDRKTIRDRVTRTKVVLEDVVYPF